MKTKKKLFTLLLIIAGITIINLLGAGLDDTLQNLKYFIGFSIAFYIVNMLYFKYIGKILSWEKEPEKTLIISILGSIPVNIILYFLLKWIFFGQGISDFKEAFGSQLVAEYVIVILFSLIIALFIIIGYSFKKIRQEQEVIEKVKFQNQQAELSGLKAQLDPHFLFNNLNVLTALIGENPKKAENFALSFSGIYKYVLENREHELVRLQDELEFAQEYLNLLQMRFEKGLQFSLPEAFPPTAQIPPLSLQILLENAVKHNLFSESNPLTIDIRIEGNYLVVSNNKQEKREKTVQLKTGLSNLKKRLELLNLPPLLINDKNGIFEVKIPLSV